MCNYLLHSLWISKKKWGGCLSNESVTPHLTLVFPCRSGGEVLVFFFASTPSSFMADNNLSSTIEQPFFADPAPCLKIYVSAENEHPTLLHW